MIKYFKKNHYQKIKNNFSLADKSIEMCGITKTFNEGSFIANEDINFSVKRNSIHAIVGENGAGKSTLMSVLFGLYKPDRGTIKINDSIINFSTPQDASLAGLGMVHQHFKLIQVFTVLENIILGNEITKFGIIDMKACRKKVTEICVKFKFNLNLDKKICDCTVCEQQQVEILKLIYKDSDIFIFDEPTAVLSDDEIKEFLKMIMLFKSEGKTIIIISHKLNEVLKVSDEITVIRYGKVVGNFPTKKCNVTKLANLMVGKRLIIEKNTLLNYDTKKHNVILSVNNLYCKKADEPKIMALKGVNFEIHAGEIFGIAGVAGNGQSELALVISGLIQKTNGDIFFYNEGKKICINDFSVEKLNNLGISHVPEDRLKYGLIGDETVIFNCVSNQISKFSKFGFLNFSSASEYSNKICSEFDVRGTFGGRTNAINLSGGNQQKLVFGRETLKPHSLIIYVQPTRGLDLGAIQNLHKLMKEESNKGNAALLISYELDEIFNIASTISVMNQGEIVYTSPIKKTSREIIGTYISGTYLKGKNV
jgi:simple sugar transport system ATP-binding protein